MRPPTAAYDGDPLTESAARRLQFRLRCRNKLSRTMKLPTRTKRSEEAARNALRRTEPKRKNRSRWGRGRSFARQTTTARSFTPSPHGKSTGTAPSIICLSCTIASRLTHGQIGTARIWASNNDVSEQRKNDFLNNKSTYENSLDHEVVRLDGFLSLVMSQLERIRVKYRPSSFYCNLPVINHLISNRCTPVRIASKTTE